MTSTNLPSVSRHRKSLAVALALGIAAPAAALVAPSSAAADGVHVRVDGRVRVSVSTPGRRVRRVRVRRIYLPGFFRAGIYIGPTFAAPPPPPPAPAPYDHECDCGGAPGASVPMVAAAPPAPRFVPRFALGFAASHLNVDDRLEGSEAALLARLRVNPRFEVELEAGGVEYEDSVRTDSRVGASAYFHLMPNARLAPYLVAGAGASRADLGNDIFVDQGYAELGAGLTLRLTERFHVGADLRGGVRGREDRHDSDRLRVVGPTGVDGIADEEEFGRFRLVGLMYF